MADEHSSARPAAPTTKAELERSIRVIRLAVVGGVSTVVLITIAFIAGLDAPAVPLIPIAVLVVLTDLGFLVIFTRQRKRALRDLEREAVGLPASEG